jgi:pyridoxine 5'-phosphate synthase PdxJ
MPRPGEGTVIILMPADERTRSLTYPGSAILVDFARLVVMDKAMRMQHVVRPKNAHQSAANHGRVQHTVHFRNDGKHIVPGVALFVQQPEQPLINLHVSRTGHIRRQNEESVCYKSSDLIVR